MKNSDNKGFNTKAIHANQHLDPSTNAVVTPIYATSTFAHESPGVFKGYDYSRFHNPTRTAFEGALVAVEKGGKKAFAFSSGMAAVSTIIATLPPKSHIIVCDDLYGGTYNLFENVEKAMTGLEITYADFTNVENIVKAIQPNTKMIWTETPSNPLLKILDLSAVAKIAKDKKLITVCDNTFASPYLQNPIEHGIDIVMHSTTKFINGHSDIVGGAVIVGDNAELAEKIRILQNNLGNNPSPFDVFLAHRGLKTLGVRMERHCQNSMEIAKYLEKHPKVEKVIYPGLSSHPQHELAKKQMKDFGAIISVIFKGTLEETTNIIKKLEIFRLAVSLGGVESLIQQPATMTHKAVPREQRIKVGIADSMVRLSVGIEDAADLIADLENAIK